MDKDIATITTEVFALLEPRTEEERLRVVKAVFALFGTDLPAASTSSGRVESNGLSISGGGVGEETAIGGPRAKSWARQHRLTRSGLEQAFYFQNGQVDIHIDTIPGKSRREQTINCYLLVGLRGFLASDSATFNDSEALALCKHTQAYDKNNHTKFRAQLGNLVNGSKDDKFELSGPGLKAAAELIGSMNKGEG